MKKLLATVFSSTLCFYSFSQKAPTKFGDVSAEDLKMKVYELDSAASAVVLYDYGETVLVPGESYFLRHSRIKILKKDGYSWADFAIPVLGTIKYSIDDFKASTFNLVNGKIEETSVDKTGKFREEFVDGIEVLKFAMSNVKEGSIIEYTYKIRSGGIRNWEFQSLIPVRYSQYKIFLSDLVKFNMSMQGYISPSVYEKKDAYKSSSSCIMQNWIMENVPAFKPEPYISSYKNYIAKVIFDLSEITFWGHSFDVLSSWDKLKDNYRSSQLFGNTVKSSAFLKGISRDATKLCKTNDEKVLAILNYVKDRMEWNGRNRTSVFDNDLKKAFDSRIGNAAEINLTLLAMLSYSDIKAEPVLISTRDNGFVRTLTPNSQQFNKVIVWTELGGKSILLDATEKFIAYNYLPENCLNGVGYGYRAGETLYQWIPLNEPAKTQTRISAKITIDEDGSIGGDLTMKKNGYAAQAVRKKIKSDKKDEYLKSLLVNPSTDFINSTFTEADSSQNLLQESHKFKMSDYCQVSGETIFINPTIVSGIEDNPFKNETREYPVDFHFPMEITYSAKFTIPPNYEVDEIPAQTLILLPNDGGKFLLNCVKNANEINFTSQFMLNQSFFSQPEYPVLREFFNIMKSKQAQQIVLRKKT